MAHHAFVFEGSTEASIAAARAYGEHQLGLTGRTHPDISVRTYGTLTVDDARALMRTAEQSATGNAKLLIITTSRIFHEAQNALLKLFEEPPVSVTLILCVPSLGVLLPTLRSRLQPLPNVGSSEIASQTSSKATAIFSYTSDERQKYIANLVERTKSDRDDVKDTARREALELLEALTVQAHDALEHSSDNAARARHRETLQELSQFALLFHDRSVPYKQIFEHILISYDFELFKIR